jgi:uncharacterized membrane protein
MRQMAGLTTLLRPRRRHLLTAVAVAAFTTPALGAPVAAAAETGCNPRVIDLGTLGGSTSEIIETNARGVWVGSASTPAEAARAVLWERGRIRDLGAVADAWASDINNSGVIVGNHKLSDDRKSGRAFIRRHGVLRELPGFPGGGRTFVRRLNDRGDATGSATDAAGTEHPVVWRRGGAPIALPLPAGFVGGFGMGINDRGDVVGAAYTADQLIAWGWDKDGDSGPLAELDRLGWSQANVLDNRGRAAGISDFGGKPGAQAALWRNGRVRSLGTFGDSDYSFALGTNGQGDYVGVGSYFAGEDEDHVFLTSARRTGPLRTLMALSGNPADGSKAHAVTPRNAPGGDVTVGGSSETTAGEKHATVWTCAYQQAFVPDIATPATTTWDSPWRTGGQPAEPADASSAQCRDQVGKGGCRERHGKRLRSGLARSGGRLLGFQHVWFERPTGPPAGEGSPPSESGGPRARTPV